MKQPGPMRGCQPLRRKTDHLMPDCARRPRLSRLARGLPARHPLWATDSGTQAVAAAVMIKEGGSEA